MDTAVLNEEIYRGFLTASLLKYMKLTHPYLALYPHQNFIVMHLFLCACMKHESARVVRDYYMVGWKKKISRTDKIRALSVVSAHKWALLKLTFGASDPH